SSRRRRSGDNRWQPPQTARSRRAPRTRCRLNPESDVRPECIDDAAHLIAEQSDADGPLNLTDGSMTVQVRRPMTRTAGDRSGFESIYPTAIARWLSAQPA